MPRTPLAKILFLTGLIVLTAEAATAQTLEPRMFSNAPVGMNFAGLTSLYSWGNVLVDPSLPVEDVEADINSLAAAYVRVLQFLGQSSKLVLVAPFVNAEARGLVEGKPASASWTGFADPLVKFSFNFVGAPAMTLQEMLSYRQKMIIGGALSVKPPLGLYDDTRRINLGANRWTLEAQFGFSRRVRRLILEATGSFIYFTDNTRYQGSSALSQDPVWALQAHVVWDMKKPGMWLAFDYIWAWGGQTTLDGILRADLLGVDGTAR